MLRLGYDDDGNLLRLTHAGGANADGSIPGGPVVVFSYTISNGAGPGHRSRRLRWRGGAADASELRIEWGTPDAVRRIADGRAVGARW